MLIELNTHIPYLGDAFPNITHYKLVNIKDEVPRPLENKPGYVEIWFSPGFISDGVFREAPGALGKEVTLDEYQFADLAYRLVIPGETLSESTIRICLEYVLDEDIFNGTIVEG